MIHDADLEDGKFGRVEAVGIDLMLKGLAGMGKSDSEILERGIEAIEALHAVLSKGANEPATEVSATRPDSRTNQTDLRPSLSFLAQAWIYQLRWAGGADRHHASRVGGKEKWISQSRFLHALNFCMLLPGPEAQQLAIYVGWLLHRTWGGIVAGSLFVIPSMFVLWALSFVYAAHGNVPWIAAIFYGLIPAVMAIVAFAVIRIGRKALKNSVMWSIAATAFIGIYFFKVPFPVIVLAAGVIGLVGGKLWREKFSVIAGTSHSMIRGKQVYWMTKMNRPHIPSLRGSEPSE